MTCPIQSSRPNHPDCIRWTVQTMEFLIVGHSPFPNAIPLGPNYSPQNPVLKCFKCLHMFLCPVFNKYIFFVQGVLSFLSPSYNSLVNFLRIYTFPIDTHSKHCFGILFMFIIFKSTKHWSCSVYTNSKTVFCKFIISLICLFYYEHVAEFHKQVHFCW